jgi:hypothetical protein
MYSYDGLHYTGDMAGAFDVGMDINFFGQEVEISLTPIDCSSVGNARYQTARNYTAQSDS